MKPKDKSQTRIRKLNSFLSRSRFIKNSKLYPSLLIQGKWFSDLGFLPGEHVQINTINNKIIIEKLEG